MVFAIQQLQEKCIEQNMDLYAAFINLTKAFDMLNREHSGLYCQNLGTWENSSTASAFSW